MPCLHPAQSPTAGHAGAGQLTWPAAHPVPLHAGVFRWDFPGDEKPNHAVVIVGWGEERLRDGTTQPYWLVKNSWYTTW